MLVPVKIVLLLLAIFKVGALPGTQRYLGLPHQEETALVEEQWAQRAGTSSSPLPEPILDGRRGIDLLDAALLLYFTCLMLVIPSALWLTRTRPVPCDSVVSRRALTWQSLELLLRTKEKSKTPAGVGSPRPLEPAVRQAQGHREPQKATQVVRVTVERERRISTPTLSRLSGNDIKGIWTSVSKFIQDKLSLKMGVYVRGLGTFAWSQTWRPIFQIGVRAARKHGLKQRKVPVAGGVRVVPVNFTALARETPFERNTVERCVHETVQLQFRRMATQRNIHFTFNGIGVLSFCRANTQMNFQMEFLAAMATEKQVTKVKEEHKTPAGDTSPRPTEPALREAQGHGEPQKATQVVRVTVERERRISTPTLSRLSGNDIKGIWTSVSKFIQDKLSLKMGVYVRGLGTFAWSQTWRPIFQIGVRAARKHGLKQRKVPVAGSVRVVPVNFTALARETPFERNTVERCVHETVQLQFRRMATQRNIHFTFDGIGVLSFCRAKTQMNFQMEFLAAMATEVQVTEVKEEHKTPATRERQAGKGPGADQIDRHEKSHSYRKRKN